MPIFEYVCMDCHRGFETLVRGAGDVECPSCNGTNLEKQLSVFAATPKEASGAQNEIAMTPCGMCGDPRGPGACSRE